MKEDVLFSEIQRFRKWWILLLTIGVNIAFFFGMLDHFKNHKEEGSEITYLIIGILSMILFNFLFLVVRLETQITKEGIYVRFYPFHLKFKFYDWKNISKFYVRQYQPILEYGGWGLRTGIFGKGRAFNISGNIGLQLEFMDNKKLLIGTGKSEELKKILDGLNS